MYRRWLLLPFLLLLFFPVSVQAQTFLAAHERYAGKYASLKALVDAHIAAGSPAERAVIDAPLNYGAAVVVPVTLTLDFRGAGQVNCLNASVLAATVQSAIIAPGALVFKNCPAIALDFTGSPQEIFNPVWFDTADIARAVLPVGAVLTSTVASTLHNGVTGEGSVVLNDSPVLTDSTLVDPLLTSARGIPAAGLDQSGTDFFLSPSQGTGTGKSGSWGVQMAYAGSSGSTPNTLIDRFKIAPEKNLTNALTNLFEIDLLADSRTGGEIHWCIEVSDGTAQQLLCGTTHFGAYNVAGTITTKLTESTVNEISLISSGALSVSWGATTAATKVTVNCTPLTSLTYTVYRLGYSVDQHTPHRITVLTN